MQNFSVVICAAGTGSRLGLSVPKSLVPLLGKTLIEWQLMQMANVEDIIVVVGFQGAKLSHMVKEIRSDAKILENPNFQTTKTASSLVIGAGLSKERVVGLDGDILISKESLNEFLASNNDLLGVMKTESVEPHGVLLEGGLIKQFHHSKSSQFEWVGPLNISREDCLKLGSGHVFEGLRNFLPLPAVEVDLVEIDFPIDLERAEKWLIKKGYHHG
jgi:choline kinase